MVKRIWHGYTSPENADAYESLLKREVLPGIAAKGIAGYRGVEVLKRALAEEIVFITVMAFDSWEAVKTFGGDDYERAYVPPAARQLLARFDDRSQHYDVIESLQY